MSNTDKLREIAEKWGCRTIPSHDFTDDKYEDKSKEILSDLNSLLEQHKEVIFTAQQSKMPTKEMIEQYFNNHFDCYTDVTLDEYDTTEQAMTKDAVLKMFEWLRNQIEKR